MAIRPIQNRPHILEIAYLATLAALRRLRRWLKPGGMMEGVFVRGERISKGIIFDCQMCGDCVLHSTGMTCPMTCPKNLRNGPCGGVRQDGGCEIVPDMQCVWLAAWERSKKMPALGGGIYTLLPPVDRQLEGTSAWINDLDGKAEKQPAGWTE